MNTAQIMKGENEIIVTDDKIIRIYHNIRTATHEKIDSYEAEIKKILDGIGDTLSSVFKYRYIIKVVKERKN